MTRDLAAWEDWAGAQYKSLLTRRMPSRGGLDSGWEESWWLLCRCSKADSDWGSVHVASGEQANGCELYLEGETCQRPLCGLRCVAVRLRTHGIAWTEKERLSIYLPKYAAMPLASDLCHGRHACGRVAGE